ncbi:uncharacterized protein LOC129921992 [Biomphalaria glabrata]|uniref:Mitochondrial fission process protein 1 n=1 Tax=Biomphalaria glabrata TaxID=6526 RepID=A0A9W2YG52_BIOGL|nr:uncharacterized protein LOC129921992 [Biomphalaria glabrata]XP_055861641.1 uncharacterized protein LOC129921992 [Biomphalaria glabrata]
MEAKELQTYRGFIKDHFHWLLGSRNVHHDLFRMLPLRILGYGYAVGVGLRFRFCQNVQDSFKAVAISFVVCHTLNKVQNEMFTTKQMVVVAADTLAFDTLAFLLLPTLTTYSVSRMVRSYIKKRKHYSKSLMHWAPILASLLVLPIVACPLEAFAERIMTTSVRTLYSLPVVH